jgi:hypothetical protein
VYQRLGRVPQRHPHTLTGRPRPRPERAGLVVCGRWGRPPVALYRSDGA